MGCIKDQYQTYDLAEAAAVAIRKKKKNSATVYKCSHCDYFHITTEVKGRLGKPKKDKKYPLKIEKLPPPSKPQPEPQVNYNYHPDPIIIHTDTIGIKKK